MPIGHNGVCCVTCADMNRLRSRLALAAFLAELGEAVEQAELVRPPYMHVSKYTHTHYKIVNVRKFVD